VRPDEILAEHVRMTTELLIDRSRVLAENVAAGRTAVVGLRYRLADGTAHLVAAHGLDAQVPAAS
jgi:carbonic anhydrase